LFVPNTQYAGLIPSLIKGAHPFADGSAATCFVLRLSTRTSRKGITNKYLPAAVLRSASAFCTFHPPTSTQRRRPPLSAQCRRLPGSRLPAPSGPTPTARAGRSSTDGPAPPSAPRPARRQHHSATTKTQSLPARRRVFPLSQNSANRIKSQDSSRGPNHTAPVPRDQSRGGAVR